MSKKAKEPNTEETIKPNMKVVYSVIIIVIAFCLFVVTSFIGNLSHDNKTEKVNKIGLALNSSVPKTLVASMPSLGPLLKTQVIKTKIDKATRNARFEMDSKSAKNIRKNQDVMLFKNDEKILYKLGNVENVVETEGIKRGNISIPEEVDLSTLSENMQILTLKNFKTKRAPLTALFEDEDNGYYVWVAEKPKKEIDISDRGNVVIDRHPELMGQTTTLPVRKYFLRPQNDNGILVDLGDRIPINTIVLLDPPELEEGQSYPVLLTQIEAPAIMPNYAQYLEDGRKRAAERMVFLRQEIAKCAANKPPPPAGITSTPQSDKAKATPSCTITTNNGSGGCGLSGLPTDYLKMLGLSSVGAGNGACGN